jgi:hypothetical protein
MTEKKEQEFPSLIEQGKNLAKSATEVIKTSIKGTPLFAPHEVQKERWDICNQCEFINKELNRCTACGCNLNMKISYSGVSCPKEKWQAWTNK